MTESFKLYGRPGSGSGACEAILALTGLPHEIIDLERWAPGGAPSDFLAINPLGQVPALVLPDGGVMTESAAICLYLADLMPEAKLAPVPGHPPRAGYLRWMVYMAANNYMTALRFYYPDRHTLDRSGSEGVKAAAIERSKAEWKIIAKAAENGPFLLGEEMSAADIYAAMLMSWDLDVPALFNAHPPLKELYAAVARHPQIAPVWRRHDMPD
jgi:glutathione S-transferase